MSVRIEWKPADLWVGAYWRKTEVENRDKERTRYDLWICLLPMVPIHLTALNPPQATGLLAPVVRRVCLPAGFSRKVESPTT